MKLHNRTDWPDWMLRRMVAWCAKQIELPMRAVEAASFGRRSDGAYSGHAWYAGRIRVTIGPATAYPTREHIYPDRKSKAYTAPAFADPIEGLIGVTAHELAHIYCYQQGSWKGRAKSYVGERRTMHEERRILDLFRADRAALLAAWNEPPAAALKSKPSRQERNEARIRKQLATWERKLKLAKTKVAAYRRKANYYDRVAAKRNPSK